MKEYKPYKEGKVRELYDLGDSLVMVCTDRISAFDKILATDIPEKGAILNCMSRFWFDHTRDIVPNHMISTDTADMPEFFRTPWFARRRIVSLSPPKEIALRIASSKDVLTRIIFRHSGTVP